MSYADATAPNRRAVAMACSPNACTDHENARGSYRSGSGGEHGENSRQSIGGEHHRFITANRGHGRKHVHALRARGTRHQLYLKFDDAIRKHLRAFGNIVRVGISGANPRIRFDDDFQASFDEIRNYGRHQRHAPSPG